MAEGSLRRDLRGVRVGPYEIVRLIGRGATSSVYEARHTVLGRSVAIKVLHEHLAGDERTVARFVREGRIAARLRHPHVVDVIDVGEQDGTPFLVMELLDGVDLGTWLRARGPLDHLDALRTVLPLASALAAAHANGALHRDLKPTNVMLARDGRGVQSPKLVDFGLSKQLGGDSEVQLTEHAAVLGTLGYIAPEQLLDAARADERSDQYGLGAILYECLTARPPYQGKTVTELIAEVRSAPPPPPSALAPGIPPGLEAEVMRALAFDPGRRHPDVRSFARALLPFADEATRLHWAPDFDGGAETRHDRTVAASAPTVHDGAASARGRTKPALATLPVPPGTSPFHIKGLGYRGMRKAIERRVPGGMDGFCLLLDDERLATFIRQPFLATSLYDTLPMLPLTQALAFALQLPFERFVFESNRQQARYDGSGVYRALHARVNEAEFASNIPRWLQRHYDFGDCTIVESSPGRIVLRRAGQPLFLLPWFAPAMAAYLVGVAELAGFVEPTSTFGAATPEGRVAGIAVGAFETEVRWRVRA